MSVTGLEGIDGIFGYITAVELAIGEFYQACASRFSLDRSFWEELSTAERQHAALVERMGEIVQSRPGNFRKNSRFILNGESVHLFGKGILDFARKIRDNEVNEKETLVWARDLEESLLERKFPDMIQSADLEYDGLKKKMFAETRMHRDLLTEKIKDKGFI